MSLTPHSYLGCGGLRRHSTSRTGEQSYDFLNHGPRSCGGSLCQLWEQRDPGWLRWAGLVPVLPPTQCSSSSLPRTGSSLGSLFSSVFCCAKEPGDIPLRWLLWAVGESYCLDERFSWTWLPSHPTSPTCGVGAQFLLSSCCLCSVRAEELHFQLAVSQGADLFLFALSSPKPGSYPPTASPCALSCSMQPCPQQHQQSSPLHLVLSLLSENQEYIQRVR